MKCFIFVFTFCFHRYAGMEEAMLGGTISIPRLQTELRSEALVNYSPSKGYLQMHLQQLMETQFQKEFFSVMVGAKT